MRRTRINLQHNRSRSNVTPRSRGKRRKGKRRRRRKPFTSPQNRPRNDDASTRSWTDTRISAKQRWQEQRTPKETGPNPRSVRSRPIHRYLPDHNLHGRREYSTSARKLQRRTVSISACSQKRRRRRGTTARRTSGILSIDRLA